MKTLNLYRTFLDHTGDPVAAALLTLADRLTPDDDAPLTVADAAKLMGCGAATVYGLCTAGWLRHHRVGKGRGSIRITRSDVELYQRSNEG